MLGRLIQSLVTINLWPVPAAITYQQSVSTLKTSRKTILVKGSAGNLHAQCSPLHGHAASVDAIINGLASLVTDNQPHHLIAQANKSGAVSTNEQRSPFQLQRAAVNQGRPLFGLGPK